MPTNNNNNNLTAHEIITAGATNLPKLTADRDERLLRGLQIAYARAVVNTLWLPVAAASAATIVACGMEWKKVTAKATKKKEEEEEEGKNIIMITTKN